MSEFEIVGESTAYFISDLKDNEYMYLNGRWYVLVESEYMEISEGIEALDDFMEEQNKA